VPLRLNVGVNRKMGLPNYGSVGASCNLELDLDVGLLGRDLDGFHAQVRGVYVAAHQAVNDELARLQSEEAAPQQPPAFPGRHSLNGHNGHAHQNGQPGHLPAERVGTRKPATESQVRAIRTIAHRQGTDLAGLLTREFRVERPEDLTLSQASRVIDALKAGSEA
jgi:hypothetical protein